MKMFKKSGLAAVLAAFVAAVAVQPASADPYTEGYASLSAATYSSGGVARSYRGVTRIWDLRDAWATKQYGLEFTSSLQNRSSGDGLCAALRLEVFTNWGATLLDKKWTTCSSSTISYATGSIWTGEARYARVSLGRTNGTYSSSGLIDLW